MGVISAVVIGVYVWSAKSGWLEVRGLSASATYYNLLAQGFRSGQLNVNAEVPPGLTQLGDPYDPAANGPHLMFNGRPLYDMSYYCGRLFLYFGVTPALILFWPWHELTGHYVLHEQAAFILCAVGFLAGSALLIILWRRCFADVGIGVVEAGMLAVGLTNFIPVILARSDVYEVAICCGYMLTTLAVLTIGKALQDPGGRNWWLAAASLIYGLAVSARPSLLPGAVILLVPVLQSVQCRVTSDKTSGAGAVPVQPLVTRHPSLLSMLLAAGGPITFIGLGLMLYNFLRFRDPLELGWRYQLLEDRQDTMHPFSLHFLWPNFRVYFLEPARLSGHFPFVHDIKALPVPTGHAKMEHAFGVMANAPFAWLALAASLVWRGWLAGSCATLRWFGLTLVLLFGACALTLGLFQAACLRYEVEFLPVLVLLAVFGVFALERSLTGRPRWQHAARVAWGLLLTLSLTFNLFARFERYTEAYRGRGLILTQQGRLEQAIIQFRKALEVKPDNEQAHNDLAGALRDLGKVAEAFDHYKEAVRIKPDFPEAHNNWGNALLQQGRAAEAIGRLEEAVRLRPNLAEAHLNLGTALLRQGKTAEALSHYRKAVGLAPDFAAAHHNLATALFQQGGNGNVAEAVKHWETALELEPNLAVAHHNLAAALVQQAKTAAAIRHYEAVLRLRPESVETHAKLAWLLATSADDAIRNGARAVELAERADRLADGKNPAILDTLAAAYAEAGRFNDAVRTAQAAIELAKTAGLLEAVMHFLQREIGA